MLIESPNTTSHLTSIVILAISLIIYGIFANEIKCKNDFSYECQGQVVEQLDLAHSTRNIRGIGDFFHNLTPIMPNCKKKHSKSKSTAMSGRFEANLRGVRSKLCQRSTTANKIIRWKFVEAIFLTNAILFSL